MTPRPASVDRRNGFGQSGQSLIEVLVAIVLAGMVFLTVAAAMLTVSKATSLNETVQAIDTGLVSYGEILQTQVEYAPCPGPPGAPDIVEAYQQGYMSPSGVFVRGADQFISGGTGVVQEWTRPPRISVRVVSVQSWDAVARAWRPVVAGQPRSCTAPDSGAQLITYQVIGCPSRNAVNSPTCAGGKVRSAEVVKRRPGPS